MADIARSPHAATLCPPAEPLPGSCLAGPAHALPEGAQGHPGGAGRRWRTHPHGQPHRGPLPPGGVRPPSLHPGPGPAHGPPGRAPHQPPHPGAAQPLPPQEPLRPGPGGRQPQGRGPAHWREPGPAPLVPGRQVLHPHRRHCHGHRAVGGRSGHGQAAQDPEPQAERCAGQPPGLAAGRHAALQGRAPRPGSRAPARRGPRGTPHPGDPGQGRPGTHLPGPAPERR